MKYEVKDICLQQLQLFQFWIDFRRVDERYRTYIIYYCRIDSNDSKFYCEDQNQIKTYQN